MQLEIPGRPHLGYCTNIHAGETWAEIDAALRAHLPKVKSRLCPDRPMGVGLRLSSIASEALAQPREVAALKAFLAEGGFYVFTVNAFPYGPFHGQRVKENVYLPDWRTPERLAFTTRVADILVQLTPPGAASSISTVPGGFKSHIATADDISQVADGLVRCAAHLHDIARKHDRVISLAIEPEPACFLETTEEAIAFFGEHLFSKAARDQFAAMVGVTDAAAERALRTHLGLCLDVCHSAVEFEHVRPTLDAIAQAGIGIAKLQLSAALRVPTIDGPTAARLQDFDDGVYLHQAVQQDAGRITRFTDLPEALAAYARGEAGGEWRVHCHVPVFLERFDVLSSTQDTLREMLAVCRERLVSPHLEVETYTWSVLPPELRSELLTDDIVRELNWVAAELGQ